MINLFGDPIEEEVDVEIEKPKKPTVPALFDWLLSINTTKVDLRIEGPSSSIGPNPSLSGFDPYIIVKGLGQSKNTIGFANVLNRNPHMDKEAQYLFLLNGIPKNKSYAKWAKNSHDKNLKSFMEATGLPKYKAIDALRILTKEQIKRILKPVGGKVSNK